MIESFSNEKANMILQELQVECESLFEFKIKKVIPIHRGWLNLKWNSNGCRELCIKAI